jgi:spore coat polysaccharide biosynthesis protein SpsF
MKEKLKIIIQARTGSTRLPGKILKPFYEDKTILDILIGNLTQLFKKEDVILATSTAPNDCQLEKIANNHGICFFQGDENNVLKRFIDCANEFDANVIVRICADNPFLLTGYISTLISQIQEGKEYASYKWPDNRPVMLSHIGLFAEAFNVSFIQRIANLTKDPLYTEHVTNFIYTNGEKFDNEFLPIPVILNESQNLRLTIDTETDFEVAQEVYKDWIQTDNQNIESLLLTIGNKPLLLEKMLKEINNNAK